MRSILVGGYDRLPLDSQRAEASTVYGRNARFVRDARTLFDSDDELLH